MIRFRDWALGKKYGLGVAIVLILMAGGYTRSFRQLQDLKSDLEAVSRNWLGRIIAVSNISRNASDLRTLQLQYATTVDPAQHSGPTEGIINLVDQINTNRDTYEELRATPQQGMQPPGREEALYATFDRHWDSYQTLTLSVVEFTMSGQREEALRLLAGEARPVFDSMNISLLGLVETNQSYALGAADRAETSLKRLGHASLILFVVTIAVSILFTIWLVRLITRPIRLMAAGAERVSAGDLSVELPITSRDEIGQLGGAFNRMTVALSEAHERSERQRESIEAANRELQAALRQLREAQDQLILQEKMASLGKLVAGVSHELNTPTGALLGSNDVTKRIVARVIGVLDTLPQSVAGDHTATMRTLLETMTENADLTEKAARRIQEIVSSLRSFVRLDEAEFQTVNIHEGIESSLTLLGTDMLHGIEIVRQYGEIPEVPCIPGQINQVFYNIIRNAAEAIDGRGSITIRTYADGKFVRAEVRDTGRGIAQSRLSQIYDVGWTATNQRVRMGSGVITAYNVIRAHGGDLRIESELGKGTIVYISLPRDSSRM